MLAHATQLAPSTRGSNSVAYFKPSQQASKHSLSLQAGSFAKIAHWAIFLRSALQNVLRPFETPLIKNLSKKRVHVLSEKDSKCGGKPGNGANRGLERSGGLKGEQTKWKAPVVVSGLLVFGSFLLEEQKK